MSSFYYECRKMFIHHKGFLIIAAFFILSLCGLLLNTPADPDIENNRASYNYYLCQVDGKCTPKVEKFLTDEAKRISNAKGELEQVYNDYYDGKLSNGEFQKREAALQTITKNENGFNLIYNQYNQIRGNLHNRYFLYTNGWNGLLSDDNLDLLSVLLLLLLITPVFCYEYESKMDSLVLTEIRGVRSLAGCKMLLVFLTVTFIGVLDSAIKYVFFQIKYGLPHGDYPLQSLTYFNTSSRTVSLLGAYIGISAGKLFGGLCLAVLILFVSVCVKKYALTLFLCTSAVLLPYFGFHLQSTKYFLPGPLGFMVSTGFFRGSAYRTDLFTKEKTMVFREVPPAVIALTVAVTILLSIAMLVFILARYTNHWSRKKRFNRRRIVPFVLMICTILSGITGCASKNNTQAPSVYNRELKGAFENQKYQFYVNSGSGKNEIMFKNKMTGKTQNLVRNPLQAHTKILGSIFGNGNDVYYIKYSNTDNGFLSTIDKISVIRVDTNHFNEEIVFERNLNKDQDTFLGLSLIKTDDVAFFASVNAFFLDDYHIYFVGEDQIRQVDRMTGKMKIIIESHTLKTIAFNGGAIYYINSKSTITKYDIKTGKSSELPNMATTSFLITKGNIYFINRKDQNRLYKMVRKDGTMQKITQDPVLYFTINWGNLVYTNKADSSKHQIVIS